MRDKDDVFVLDEPNAAPSRQVPAAGALVQAASSAEIAALGDVFIIEDAPMLTQAQKTKEIRALENAIANLIEASRAAGDAIAEANAEIDRLAKLAASSHPMLPRYDIHGNVIAEGPPVRLARAREQLAALERTEAARGLELIGKRKELDAAISAVLVTRRRPTAEIEARARDCVVLAGELQQAAEAFGQLLRAFHANETAMAEIAGTVRALNMLSLPSLRARMAYALTASGAFEVNPQAGGVRGARAFIALEGTDPTHPWRGRTFAEIVTMHYRALIAEVSRGA